MIECDVGDTGSLELPADMIDQLKALGISGWPSIVVSRKAIGLANNSQVQVDLVIVSTLEMFVDIPGLVSCTCPVGEPCPECPAGQTCQDDLKCE